MFMPLFTCLFIHLVVNESRRGIFDLTVHAEPSIYIAFGSRYVIHRAHETDDRNLSKSGKNTG
jgi:hypothetical protein